jgi:NAD+ synthase (glutamine-hydrolysing)
MMPSPYTADISWIDARDMAARLGVRYDEIADRAHVRGLRAQPGGPVRGLRARTPPRRTSRRASAARCSWRLSNKTGAIVLTTGNKSEMATGYCTLYGDMAGGFAVIKDVAKTLVYRLADWKNCQPVPLADGSIGPVIPQRIITRAALGRIATRPDRPGQPAALRGARRDPGPLHGGRPERAKRSSLPATPGRRREA